MQLYKAGRIVAGERQVRVELLHRPSSCKPRDRWLKHEDSPQASRCCTPALEKVGRFG
jgi:hypothetical protein